MSILEAIFLGFLQGITEFLPISSSGHLALAAAWLDARPPTLLFDILLHLGTLAAVCIVFRRDLTRLIRDLFWPARGEWLQRPGVKQTWLLILATLPTAAIGLGLSPLIGDRLPIAAVGGLLIVNGLILLTSRRKASHSLTLSSEDEDTDWGITYQTALLVGLAQGIGVLPGISRSGITITLLLLLSVRWRPAATFSFLLSIPAILGAVVLEARGLDQFSMTDLYATSAGVLVAALTGVGALVLLMSLLKKARFHHFSWYCCALGLIAVITALS